MTTRRWYRFHADLYLTDEQVAILAQRGHDFIAAAMAEVQSPDPIMIADVFMGDLTPDEEE